MWMGFEVVRTSSVKYGYRFLRELVGIQQTTNMATFFSYLWAVLINLPNIIQMRSLFPADKKMIGRHYTFWPLGKSIDISGEQFTLAREIYCQKCYFLPPGFNISPNDIVIDLGANAGVFTVLAALHAKKVIAVEALSGFIPEIEKCLKQNKCLDKVYIELGLVGGRSGFFSDKTELMKALHYNTEPPQISLSEITYRYQIEKIDFLKIDIEGSEFDVFSNDVSWLAKVDKIAMEVHINFGNVNQLVELLKNCGFKVWLADKNLKIVTSLEDSIGYLFANRAWTSITQ